jgi:hypothetical protein
MTPSWMQGIFARASPSLLGYISTAGDDTQSQPEQARALDIASVVVGDSNFKLSKAIGETRLAATRELYHHVHA